MSDELKLIKKNDENYYLSEEINGSRVEKRTCKVIEDLSHLSTVFEWKGLKKIVMIETQTYLKSEERTRSENRFYITSKETSAENYLKISRNHWARSEEHTSELQSRPHLVCRLL